MQRFFLNRSMQCARLDPFPNDTVFFDKNSRDFVHLGKWSDPPNALASNILALSCQKSSTSAKCDTTLGTAILTFSNRCQVTRDNLCVAVCLRVARACISYKIPFCLANPLGSYLWKLSGLQILINKCVILDTHHWAFGSHWRIFGGQFDRACFHSL